MTATMPARIIERGTSRWASTISSPAPFCTSNPCHWKISTGRMPLTVSGILPVLIFQWQGFEVQNGAGEEMVDAQRDVPRSIIRAGIVAVIAYAAFLITILLVLPKD